tara:strand:- start:748 stop:1029 length:282 start_codon:yes stop_codon:yes gene_type:complete
MGKKQDVIDLKPKAERISENQLKSLQDIVSFINQQQIQVGALETRKTHVINEIMAKQGSLISLQQVFKEEYGTDNINIHDGTINYDDEADKED